MENSENQVWAKHEISEELPSLFKHITSITVAGFDVVEDSGSMNHKYQPTPTGTTTSCRSADAAYTKVDGATAFQTKSDASQVMDSYCQIQSISISIPSSPLGLNIESMVSILFSRNFGTHVSNESPNHAAASAIANINQPNQGKNHSQSIPAGSACAKAMDTGRIPYLPEVQQKDKRFDSFKTWSGKLERQISQLRGRHQEPEPDGNDSQHAEVEALPVDRYFAALEGPELDTLRASEELVLPKAKMWPFLLRFPVTTFGICLGVSSQAILWKTLATSTSTSFLHVSLNINLVLWCIAVALMIIVSSIYSLKVIFYFEGVRRECYNGCKKDR